MKQKGQSKTTLISTFLLAVSITFVSGALIRNTTTEKHIEISKLHSSIIPVTTQIETQTIETLDSFVQRKNTFGLNVFKELVEKSPNQNILISPTSIHQALSMLIEGAEGTTKEQLKNSLELYGLSIEEIQSHHTTLLKTQPTNNSDITFNYSNSIWTDDSIQLEYSYKNSIQTQFGAKSESLDLQSLKTLDIINSWVEKSTNSRIPNIINEPLDENTLAILLNTVYFNGAWTQPFDPATTTSKPFNNTGNSQTRIPMMQSGSANHKYSETDLVQTLVLPYGQKESFEMIVHLPKDIDASTFVQSQFDSTYLKSDPEKDIIDLYFPRFTFQYQTSLQETLGALGVNALFSPELANLSNMFVPGPETPYINSIQHKSFLEINEEGTEAAAATTALIFTTSYIEPIIMNIDKPFIFMIRNTSSGEIVFMGIVNNL